MLCKQRTNVRFSFFFLYLISRSEIISRKSQLLFYRKQDNFYTGKHFKDLIIILFVITVIIIITPSVIIIIIIIIIITIIIIIITIIIELS